MEMTSADSVRLSAWQPVVSGRAQLQLSAAAGRVAALRMDFDFKDGAGFVVARRAIARAMPVEYAVRFRLRGRGPLNNLELKLVDASGQNVWRYVIKALPLPARWKRMQVTSRDFEFAWGPASGSAISQLGSIEFAVVAGEGGKGTLYLADLQIADCGPREAPRAEASSAMPGYEAQNGLAARGWKPRTDDRRPWIVVDSMQQRTLGGLIIDWLGAAPARGFRVRVSNTGRRWRTLYTAASAGGNRSYVYLPAARSRLLRLEINEASAGAALRLQSFEFSRSIEAFWNRIAAAEPRGWHPRWLHREQSVWTPIGTSHGTQCALMNGDGMVEAAEGSCSIEPMMWVGGRLFTWTDVTARLQLQEDWIPVPTCIWETADWRLRILAEATPGGVVRVRYGIDNLTDRVLDAHLYVVVRPFQVTPPWQKFRQVGGVRPIHDIEWRQGAVRVDAALLVVPAGAATFGAMRFDDGCIASRLARAKPPAEPQVHDAFGFASGAIDFPLALPAHGSCEHMVNCAPPGAERAIGEAAFDWTVRLPTSQWAGNGWIAEAVRAALTATAHILVTRSGPALQPGPRRYTRSWIRDGAMMSAALLRMGHADEVREYIRWYAPHQRADGFVPCCVDRDGIDWLVEHDSHGQLVALIADYHRFTGDAQFLRESWGFVEKAVACIAGLLDATGLLPVSVSHEGYLAQPVHSYWDDFWALRGLRDAVGLAQAQGRGDLALEWEALTARFASSLFASVESTRAARKLEFIPGSVEWADFDPTATANALYLLDVPDGLDRTAVERTFDLYLADWRGKRSGAVPYTNYTPYEIRIIGAFVRLGRREAALELLNFFLSDRRPPPWNQWPEIAWRDHATPAHIGDLPHTWIAAEYVLAIRSLFAYERDADRSLVLAAGLAPEWLDGAGVRVNAMPTAHGSLSYSLKRGRPGTLQFEIDGATRCTLVLRPPLPAPLRALTVDGVVCTSFDRDSVTLPHGPAQVVCTTY